VEAPGVALLGEPVGWLGDHGRVGRQLGDARAGGGQLALGVGDVTVDACQLHSRVQRLAVRSEAGEPVLLPAASLVQGTGHAVVRCLDGIGRRAQPGALGMDRFSPDPPSK
jgi:hypothetical protein